MKHEVVYNVESAMKLTGNSRQFIEALIEVHRRIAAGEILYYPPRSASVPEECALVQGEWINMRVWNCGSVKCIGGWVETIITEGVRGRLLPLEVWLGMGSPKQWENRHDLFHPKVGDWEKITADQILTAIRSYLTTGVANWPAICARR